MKFTIKTQCFITRYYEVETKTKRKAENYYWKHLSDLDELKEFTEEDQHEIVWITEKTDD